MYNPSLYAPQMQTYPQFNSNLPYQMPNAYTVPQNQAQTQPATQDGGSFYFVNSKQDAENWVVGAGQTVFFFDRNASVFYIKSVAQNGLSQPLEVYDYKQRVETSFKTPSKPIETTEELKGIFVPRNEFDALKLKIEGLIEELGGTDKENEKNE